MALPALMAVGEEVGAAAVAVASAEGPVSVEEEASVAGPRAVEARKCLALRPTSSEVLPAAPALCVGCPISRGYSCSSRA